MTQALPDQGKVDVSRYEVKSQRVLQGVRVVIYWGGCPRRDNITKRVLTEWQVRLAFASVEVLRVGGTASKAAGQILWQFVPG